MSFLATIAAWMHTVLPEFIRLPSLSFVLPHSVYWLGLVLFPLAAIYLVRRSELGERSNGISAPIAYMLWIWGGIAGLHRFYLRSAKVGFIFVVLFVGVLYGNSQVSELRNVRSEANNQFKIADFDVERFGKALERGRDGAAEKLAAAKQALEKSKQALADASLTVDQWSAFVGGLALMVLIILIVDAFLIPKLTARCKELEKDRKPPEDFIVMERGAAADPRNEITNPFIEQVDRLSGAIGTFVAYWSMIAVFVYYYEVIARYVFNSPTNWAHESMFLMFGMQYLLCGAYAYREDAHVRVDVIYEKFSLRNRARIDVVTSFFFFVFTLTLLVTGYFFARDAIGVFEVSFTEWAIQYWPVKCTITLGAALVFLQGAAKLTRDVIFLSQTEAA